jgi:hypothetical protein
VEPVRDAQAETAAASAPHSTYVVFPGDGLDKEITAWVTANHAPARRTIVGDWAVWAFTSNVSPQTMGLDSSF